MFDEDGERLTGSKRRLSLVQGDESDLVRIGFDMPGNLSLVLPPKRRVQRCLLAPYHDGYRYHPKVQLSS